MGTCSRLAVIFCWSLLSCHAEERHASIVRQGLVEGLPPAVASAKKARFESSAVITDGTYAWISSDKAAPSTTTSSVIRVPLDLLRNRPVIRYEEVTPVMADEFRDTQKIEAAAASPEGVTFACTAFDRYDPAQAPTRQFNRLLAWPSNQIDKAAVLNPTVLNEKPSSISLRDPIRKALAVPTWPEGPPYFKIEGLAALPGHRLWFGIRATGKSYEDFAYAFQILETTWKEDKGVVTVEPSFNLVLNVNQAALEAAGVNRVAGLSSLEYDPYHKTVWAVASWEEGTVDGSWLFTIEDPIDHPSLHPVLDANGKILTFPHKVEGLAVLDAHTLLTISDEDERTPEIQTPEGPMKREPWMGVWSLLAVP